MFLPATQLSFIYSNMTRRNDLHLQGYFLGVTSGLIVTARFIS